MFNKFPLASITKVGVTSKGAIYLTYTTEKGNGCSFVAFAELRAALGVNSSGLILAKVASDRTADLLTYNRSFFPQLELNEYIEQQAAEVAPEYIFIQRQIEKILSELSLTAKFIEDEGELFARIYSDKFLGIINADPAGKLTIITDSFKSKRVWSVSSAIALIAGIDTLPSHRSTDEEIERQNQQMLNRGAFVGIDNTVMINQEFYRRMGSLRQVGVYKKQRRR